MEFSSPGEEWRRQENAGSAPHGRTRRNARGERPGHSGRLCPGARGLTSELLAQRIWASPTLPASTHDLTSARQHGIIETLTEAGLGCWADKAYQGVGGPVRVPFRGRRLKQWKRRHNTTHAKIRCLGEQAMATLEGWRLLRKLRCSTNRITDFVKAVFVLPLAST
ncbi:transposase family protein [Streptomyces sp. ML-6]|uniref:transposase family protein n=1 Tax=Streptomyces sp. ML-6 TaxID=2982693 RepID=UPI0024BFD29F|nr:transposase family protein [Streptomyces sp. ML-6]MDK0523866.1 hypothetical protein [Streptomyces sp. ML-6]